MTPRYTTPVPNLVFDGHLHRLKPAELKVLLIIIRQTLGWIDSKTGKRKKWDWISNSQFGKKTGLSRKAVSTAIDGLVTKQLIVAADHTGFVLSSADDRKHAKQIYYTLGASVYEALPDIR